MISKKLIAALLGAATKERKDKVITELLNHISLSYDYNDTKAGHILEMLVDDKATVKTGDVNISYLEKNLKLIMYKAEDYNIRNIKVSDVDNIDCNVKVEFEYIEKINEDRADCSYNYGNTTISFIDTPDILK